MKKEPVFFSIIIPNMNGLELLKKAVLSVYNQTYRDFEIIVIDNGSRDGSVFFVKEHFPEVRVRAFNKNKGFSAAVNIGISISQGEYIFLLNNDTELDKECLFNIANKIINTADHKIGFFQTKMINYNNRDRIDSAGIFIDDSLFAHQEGLEEDVEKYNSDRDVWGVCAGAAIYKREMLDGISLNNEYFDNSFFTFYEDVDISFRCRLKGWKAVFINNAIVYHIGGATTIPSGKKLFLLERNRIFMMIKNLPLKILINTFKSRNYFDRRSFDFYKGEKRYDILLLILLGHIAFIPYLFSLIIKRYKIQKNKVVSDEEIWGWLEKGTEPQRHKGTKVL